MPRKPKVPPQGEPTTEAPVNGGRNYNGPKVVKFLVKWRQRRPPSGGARAIRPMGQETISGRQFLWGVGLPKVTEACKGFLGPDGDWPSSAKAKGSLTARPTRRAGTKVGHNDPTVSSERAIA
ncbi:hypothetical protein E2542_SST22433 [Spatholobus suberectus]|nr:hypothetical protein E2542_SST22433 [Spatholobus suberectus]